MFRYVDDITSGPNPFLEALLYTDNTMMAGLVKGVYPPYLHLKPTAGDMYKFPTLDVLITATVQQLLMADGGQQDVMQATTTIYDKRREPCFHHIPINFYTHISSTITSRCGYNIIHSQCCRFLRICTKIDDFITETAMVVYRMYKQGYSPARLLHRLSYWLPPKLAFAYGDAHDIHVMHLIRCEFSRLQNQLA